MTNSGILTRALEYRNQAIKQAKELEKNKFLLFLWPPRFKKYYICQAVIKCIDELLK